jgi:hypothetical protein
VTRRESAREPLTGAVGVPSDTTCPSEVAPVIGQEPSSAPRSRTNGPPANPTEFAEAVRHLAWRRMPEVTLDVDTASRRLIVTCYPGLPDVEVDDGVTLSAGFHRSAGEYLLTSLCLDDVSDWSLDRPDVRTARELLGRDMVLTAEDLLAHGGRAGIVLDRTEADRLVDVWCAFVGERAGIADG